MPKISRSHLAESDLVEIWLNIADDNPDAADRFLGVVGSRRPAGRLSAAGSRRATEVIRKPGDMTSGLPRCS